MQIRRAFSLLAVCLGVGLGDAPAATKWNKLQTDDFVVLSDASTRDIVEFAVGYSAFRHTLRTFFTPTTTLPPSTVLLFRSKDTLRDYVPRPKDRNSEMLSFSIEVDAEALIAISLGGNRTQALELTYEFETTWAMRRLGYFLPLWMAQGTGEVFASLELRKGKCTVGEGPDRMSGLWRNTTLLPWKKFFEIHNDSPEYSGPQADGAVQGQAWALMHRVLLEGPGGRERFEALAAKLRTTGGLEAVEAVLGLPANEFNKDLSRHLSRRDARLEIPFDDARVRASAKVLPATDGEVRIQLSNLLLAAQKPDEAAVEFARAQAVTPDAPAVKEWLARRELRENRPDEAARLYREAIAAGSRNPVAYLISADQRMTDSRSSNVDRTGGGGRDLDESINEIRQAIRLNPGSAQAYRLLGRAFFLHPNPTPDHVTELSRGVMRGTDGGQVQFYRALLHERLAMKAEYAADLRAILAAPDVPTGLRRMVGERLERETFRAVQAEVESLAEAKKYAEAHAAVTKARTPELERETDQMFDQLDRWITQGERWEELKTLYAEKQWTACRAAAKSFLADFPRSSVVPKLKQMDAHAQRMLERPQ